MKFSRLAGAAACAAVSLGVVTVALAGERAVDPRVERGRYLVTIGGCNDCHTPGYMQQGPEVPEGEWLKGLPIGFQGPWGTTYPSNLRLVVAGMTEAQWLEHARKERLPPMPWFNLRRMTDADLKAVYAYIRSLGAPGTPVPAYVAPGGKVTTPYFVFVPQVDQAQVAAR
jgi:mono/diheme cytochrome c family protein